MTYTPEYSSGLLNELRALPKETEWVEFNHNNEDPHTLILYGVRASKGA